MKGSNLSKIKYKILWVIDGSLSKQLHQNARLKPAEILTKHGWDVNMITSAIPKGANKSSVNFTIVRWPDIYLLGPIIYYMKVVKSILSNKMVADILFFQMDSMAFLLLIVPFLDIILNRNTCSAVLDYRSLPMDTRSAKGRLRALMYHLGVLMARHLNIKSTAITEEIVKALKLRRKQIVGIWPSGASVEDFNECYEKRQWPEQSDPIRLIYIGVITDERNLLTVIKAVDIARSCGIQLELAIVGDGNQKDILKKYVLQNKIDFIKIDGPIPYKMIPELLAQNHIGILPFPDVPKMNVSSAIKMFEYMAAGMPIIATKIQAHVNVFKDESFVFWCTEDAKSMVEAIRRIEYSKQQLCKLGNDSKRYSRNWSWEKSGFQLSNSLKEVIKC